MPALACDLLGGLLLQPTDPISTDRVRPRRRRWVSRAVHGACAGAALFGLPLLGNAAGNLDSSFGVGGKVTSDRGFAEEARAVVVQRDGKVVVAGFRHEVGGLPDFALVRHHPDGRLDHSFGDAGWVTTDFGGGSDVATALVLQSDDKLVAGGWAGPRFQSDFALARYHPDGTLDDSFGTMGRVTTDFEGAMASGLALVQQPDGKFVLAGRRQGGDAGDDFILVRYRNDGTLDGSFGSGGRVRTDLGGLDIAHALALQADGRLVVAGSTSNAMVPGDYGDFAVVRYAPDGSPDPTFGAAGVVITNLGAYDVALAVLVQPDGKLVVAGEGGKAGDPTFVLARYGADGSLDGSFGSGGLVAVDFPDGATRLVERQPTALLQADGKVVLAGHRGNPGGASDDFALVRYQASGSLDASFGGNGLVTTDFAGAADRAFAVALQADGRLVAAGSTHDGTDIAIARYLADSCGNGVLDAGEQCDDANLVGGDCCSPTCTMEPDGVPCDDRQPCTIGETCSAGVCRDGIVFSCPVCDSCDGSGGCISGPRAGCRPATPRHRARLAIGNSARDGGDDLYWRGRVPASLATFGDPRGAGDYAVCLYDESVTPPALTFAAAVPGGDRCGSGRCWTALGSRGFRYRSRGGYPDGVRRVLLRARGEDQTSIAVRSGGPHLVIPSLPLAVPFRLQLHAASGACWEAAYDASEVRRNHARGVLARGIGR